MDINKGFDMKLKIEDFVTNNLLSFTFYYC